MKIALCHEWLNFRHGSEKTFEHIARVFPEADLYALTLNRSADFDFGGRNVHTTFLDSVGPLATRRYLQLPLMPLAWRLASRRRYDLVVTSSHACVKGFGPAREALHLCYCYTPMRYVWLPELDERRHAGWAERLGRLALRRWDRGSAGWVDSFAAISTAVQERVERIYQRPAIVIHPPVDTGFYTADAAGAKSDFALVVSRLIPYKKVDIAIRACHDVRIPLTVTGFGPSEPDLRRVATELGAEVEFVGNASDENLRDLYRRARLVIFPAEEDFGIVPVEAQACGTPVVAFGRGGSLETVVAGVTGIHVADQPIAAFAEGIRTALATTWDPTRCRANAERFSVDRCRREFGKWVTDEAGRAGVEAPTPVV